MAEATPKRFDQNTQKEQFDTLSKVKRRAKSLDQLFISSYRSLFIELVEYFMPRNGMYLYGNQETQQNRSKKKGQKIINDRGMLSRRVLSSGIQSGLTSHARPWIKFTLPNNDGAEIYIPVAVLKWLDSCSKIFLAILAGSNFYSVMQGVYDELIVLGTGVLLIEEDFNTVVRFRHFTVGEYRLAADSANRVDTLVLPVITMTVDNVVQEYGLDNVRESTRNQYKNANLDEQVRVSIYIGPNPDFGNPKSKVSKAAFVKIEWEEGMSAGEYLRISGYAEQPFAAARWQVIGTDVYGSDCPGMAALASNKQLQVMEKKKLRALDKMVDPPLVADPALENKGVVTLAGGVNYADPVQGNPAVRTAYEVRPDLAAFTMAMQDTEKRINEHFFVDAFLSFSQTTKRMTKYEAEEWAAEKLAVLGPVAELVESETLKVIVDRVFAIASRFRLFPPPPPELASGAPIHVEYLGALSQAQKLSGAQSIERFMQFALAMSQGFPDTALKVNAGKVLDEYALVTGMQPSSLNDDKAVQEAKQQQEQMQQMQAALAMSQQASMADHTTAQAEKARAEAGQAKVAAA